MESHQFLGVGFREAVPGHLLGLGEMMVWEICIEPGQLLHLADTIATQFQGLVGVSSVEEIDTFQQLVEAWQVKSPPKGGSIAFDLELNLTIRCQLPEGILEVVVPEAVYPYLQRVLAEEDKLALAKAYYLAALFTLSPTVLPDLGVESRSMPQDIQAYTGHLN